MSVKYIDIDALRLSQMYLSQKKIANVLTWFAPTLYHFEPILVHDISGDGNLHITDGHTRTFVAWRHGLRQIPYIYDEDEVVTCAIGKRLYGESVVWCNRFGLNHISSLAGRILTEDDYDLFWLGRCDKMHNLQIALFDGTLRFDELRLKKENLAQQGLLIYGISKDFSTIYSENELGELFETAYATV